MAGSAILSIKILADAANAVSGMNEAETSVGKFQSGLQKAAVPATAALAGIGAVAFTAAEAAAEDAKAADLLANSLRNATGATDKQIAATEDWISKTSASAAVADDQLRPALATLVRATGDVSTAQDAMGAALDISAATGADLESVADGLAKGYAGNTAALGKLVPGLDKAIVATGDMDQIMAELARTTGGAATDAANSAAGQVEGMKIAFGEAQEELGSALLPALTILATLLKDAATWAQKNADVLLVVGGIIAGVAVAILAVNAALKVYQAVQTIATAVTWAMNAALLANPITWIVIGVLALIAAIVLLIMNWDKVVEVVTDAWAAIVDGATAAWTWVKDIGQKVSDWFAKVWDSVKAAAGAAWDGIKAGVAFVFNLIRAIVMAYVGFWVSVWNGIASVAAAVWDGIKTGAAAAFDWLKSAVNVVIDAISRPFDLLQAAFDKVVDAIKSVIDWIRKIEIPKIDLPFGLGSRAAPAAPTFDQVVGRSAGATSSAAAAGGITINVSVPESSDPVATARYIKKVLRRGEAAGVLFGTA